MKKFISLVLSVSILLSMFSMLTIPVAAEENTLATENEEEILFYSDLFFGYSQYLAFPYNEYLNNFQMDSNEIFNNIIDEYITTEHFKWSVYYHAINIATDPTSLTKYVSDNIGLTNFKFNDELDSANQKFVEAICNLNLSAAGNVGKENKYVKNINSFLQMAAKLEKIAAENEAYYKNLEKPELYETFLDQSIGYLKEYCTELSPKLPSLGSQIYTTICETSEILGNLSDALGFVQALALSITMQETQMQIIQEIIDTQPTNSTLYKGMIRLKQQLSNGFLSYFSQTYIKDKIYDSVIEAMNYVPGKAAEWALGGFASLGSVTVVVFKILCTAVFDWIFDLDYSEYTSAVMLYTYANDLSDSLKNKSATFSQKFSNQEIDKFQILFETYIGMKKAAFEEMKNLSKYNKTYGDTYYNCQKHLFERDNAYEEYVNSTIEFIKSFPMEKRLRTDFGTWKITSNTTLSGPSNTIKEGFLYLGKSFKGSIERHYDYAGYSLSFTSGEIYIDGNLTISLRTTTFSIPSYANITVGGNFSYYKPDKSGDAYTSAYFYNYGKLNINGNATISGSYSYYWGGSKKANFYNYGTFTTKGDLILDEIDGVFSNSGTVKVGKNTTVYNSGEIINKGKFSTHNLSLNTCYREPTPYQYSYFTMDSSSAVLELTGNFSNNRTDYCRISAGTVRFSGTTQQTIQGINNVYNMEVTNPEGIQGPINLYGKCTFNNNTINNNTSYIYCYSGCSFGDNSNFGNLYISSGESVTLSQDIIANKIYCSSNSSLTTSENTNSVVNSNLICYGTITNNGNITVKNAIDIYPKTGKLYNNGNINVLTLNVNKDTSYNYGYFSMTSNKAVLNISGNCNAQSTSCFNITSGEIIFSGTNIQTIQYLSGPIMKIENNSENGVVFQTTISPSTLFNHNGNKFTLYNNGTGSTFVDYDGDELNDNVDPIPTIGNPCSINFLSGNEEYGNVSTSQIETYGGSEVTVTATPTSKYTFSKWVNSAGENVSSTPTYTFVAKKDDTFTAVFVKRSQYLIRSYYDGGYISSPSRAEIESLVTVKAFEREGYIFTQGSLKYNGIPIEDNTFIMPDETVTLTAEFIRNENYFALKEKIAEASAITYDNYSAQSFENLQTVISNANMVLENHITEEIATQYISELQNALNFLTERYIISLKIASIPVLYVGIADSINNMTLNVTYDNGISEITTDFVIENYDCNKLGTQLITVTHNDFSSQAEVTVVQRYIWDIGYSSIPPQIYTGENTVYKPEVTLRYYRTNELLIENIDYTIEYLNNTAPGTATIRILGIGNYTGSRSIPFSIVCEHNYEVTKYIAPTCTEDGYRKEVCSICDAIKDCYNTSVFSSNLPQSSHNYSNNTNTTYTYLAEGAKYLDLQFSSSTKVESGYDYIYIYDGKGTQIGKYTGTSLASSKIRVTGDTVKIKITSDSSVTYYGFSLTSITATYLSDDLVPMGHTPADWIITKEPTVHEQGIRQQICATCGYVINEETIAKLIRGDVNGDGVISAVDLVKMRIALLTSSSDTEYDECYDANGDGKVNIIDLVRLKKYLVGMDVPLGPENTETQTVELLSQPAYLEQKSIVI